MSLRRTGRIQRKTPLRNRSALGRHSSAAARGRESGPSVPRKPAQAKSAGSAEKLPSDFPPAVRKVVAARSEGICERGGTKPATDMHHRRRRDVLDELTHTAVNALHLCRGCHRWAHANPAEARREGVIVQSWEDPRALSVVRDYVLNWELDASPFPVRTPGRRQFPTPCGGWSDDPPALEDAA